ncbi:primase-helicase zinc-binding domain-containing protein [Aeromonas sp. LsrichE-8G]|uniref:primase-helicase zinc-binding domain-containing protein n=1 Tax=Aeromonas sp. LsrichE-8G TaxID=2932048 RepID=UPI001FD43A58|nr:primase-helicase zinc-binding domain-containing protein [Aeromonas sp. LsrichE-8G]MCJ7929177.1 toprim domain-containing protein [Aeromonas sp. LsrichE-8G]
MKATTPGAMSPRLVSDVVAAAVGHWPDLLAAVGIDIPRRGKHGPCPACGGKDRFRLDDKGGRGTWICNQCGNGDGLDLLVRVTGKSTKEAAELLAPLVGLSAGGLDPAERERIQRQQQAKTEQERQRAEQQRQKAARRAADIMADTGQGESPYLERKGFGSHLSAVNRTLIREGGENFHAGSLVVALTDEGGALVNVQLIRADGSKRYLAGGQKAGAYHRIEGGALVAVVEGYATGLSVHLAIGATVYCAMDAGNLHAVAQIARRQHPEARILLCGDNDEGTQGNPGKAKSEQAAVAIGGLVALPPEFSGDWNDYHQAHGLEETKRAIMQGEITQQDQDAHQREGAPWLAEVIPLQPEHESPAPMIDKMSASQRAALLIERLGEVAINMEAERVYHYSGSLWEPLTDTELRREMAAIFTEHSAPFSDKGVGAAVSTMKLMIPALGQPAADLIGFANGVYDMAARRFRPHSPSDGLLNHNGINYAQPLHGECIEHHAPSFTKWLNHAAEGDAGKMERIKAALFMVLANRYDWQLFLEVTGEGGSGKSVFANIAAMLAGGPRNTGSGNMAALDYARGRAQFVDKRLILLPDQPKYIGDGSGIKAITGGDMVEIDGKYEKQFAAVIQAVVLATNNEPMVITERNGGVSRRRVIFTFNQVVTEADKDPLLGEKIAAELPVVIRHLLTLFADPERARIRLLEQRCSDDALAIKRATDPVIDLCAMLTFMDKPEGLFMGGNPSVKQEPRRYLYHLYLAYLDYHGLGRPLSVQKFSQAVKSATKEFGREYITRKVKGYAQTNATPTEATEVFMPQAVHIEE